MDASVPRHVGLDLAQPVGATAMAHVNSEPLDLGVDNREEAPELVVVDGAAEHDAAHVINEIFKSANCKTVQKIDLRVQAHVGFGDDLKKWTDVLIVDALRSSHKKDVLLNTVEECSRYLKWFNVRTNF